MNKRLLGKYVLYYSPGRNAAQSRTKANIPFIGFIVNDHRLFTSETEYHPVLPGLYIMPKRENEEGWVFLEITCLNMHSIPKNIPVMENRNML